MRIINSKVDLSVERTAFNKQETTISIRTGANPAPTPQPPADAKQEGTAGQEKVTLSSPRTSRTQSSSGPYPNRLDWRIELLRRLLESITGRPVKLSDFDGEAAQAQSQQAAAQPPIQGGGGGVSMEFRHVAEEFESATYRADGLVKTSDGREISFNAELMLSRSFRQETTVTIGNRPAAQPRMCDPLVINFDGTSAQLSAQTFAFDLDADGKQENISQLKHGSGFLALDKNGDGVINDGSELFGTKSGDGFADLAIYDGDKNGWIDEGDAIWGQLRVWIKDDAGNDRMLNLTELGVGAIYLGSARGDFTLKDDANNTLGQVRSSGVWLSETGGGGVIQHVDLAI
ncbi:hypothetical protein GCM10007860_22740 [Chitiniphilus shinanonensis]|uniref:VCBS repeat-containing protein n=1 Tax=Chitiniphilus shinanonensis TaxID=553088 RepID=A0ABQ6BZI1_9NEIS|nr:hypothetical protein [Chitiniphilus shinanonensis]GLS05124.1 hypothetical protein GCM10007860_22740 [Chitiniphilus shinanonensis]